MSAGGSAVAESLDGRLIASNTNDPDERKLLNVVEEMSIASGVPMPKVYVLDNEDGINAFAAGHTPSDAAVAVTRNCMTKLSRDELQGVIGHEFSHILNGDMRLNIRLIGILFGIFCIATIGRILLYTRSSNSRDKNPLPIIGLLLLVIGSLGVFFGRLIQAAVSRQREFLADASSVQFTRNPAGLSGALQKIGGYGSLMESPHASDASHLFFASGLTDSFFGAMATHPPLDARIRAIDPNWDGKFHRLPDDTAENLHLSRNAAAAASSRRFRRSRTFLARWSAARFSLRRTNRRRSSSRSSVLPNLGNPTPLHLKYAEAAARCAAGKSEGRRARTARRHGVDLCAAVEPGRFPARHADCRPGRSRVAVRCRKSRRAVSRTLPKPPPTRGCRWSISRCPRLRQMDAGQFSQFSQTLQWLIDSDGKVELFEFVVQKIVLRHLDSQFNGARKPAVQFYTLKPLVPDCAVVLSALANVGSSDRGEIEKAFDTGAPYLRAPDDAPLALLPPEQCGVNKLTPR